MGGRIEGRREGWAVRWIEEGGQMAEYVDRQMEGRMDG